MRRESSHKKNRQFKKGLDISIVPNFNVSLSINNDNAELCHLLNKTLGMNKRESARSPEKPVIAPKPPIKYNTIMDTKIKSNSMINNYSIRPSTIYLKKSAKEIENKKLKELK